MARPDLLYHYTCSHSIDGIECDGQLLPNAHPLLPALGPIVWLTDIGDHVVAAYACGFFPRVMLDCDRSEICYPVVTSDVVDLVRWRDIREQFSASTLQSLEAGAMPDHWWLTGKAVPLRMFA